jgi:hypothetical protein
MLRCHAPVERLADDRPPAAAIVVDSRQASRGAARERDVESEELHLAFFVRTGTLSVPSGATAVGDSSTAS